MTDPYRATPKTPRHTLFVEIDGRRHTLTGDKCSEIIAELRKFGCSTEQIAVEVSPLITRIFQAEEISYWRRLRRYAKWWLALFALTAAIS